MNDYILTIGVLLFDDNKAALVTTPPSRGLKVASPLFDGDGV